MIEIEEIEVIVTPEVNEVTVTPVVNTVTVTDTANITINKLHWGTITGDIEDQTDLQLALSELQDAIDNINLSWGNIIGDISNQTDLQLVLATKAAILDLASVAFSGDYDDLINTPTIVTDHTQLSSIGTNSHADIDLSLTRLENTSGTNTGDQDLSVYVPYTGATSDVNLGLNGLIVNDIQASIIEFDNLYLTTEAEPIGSLFWNEVDGTINIKLKNNSILQTGQELHFYGKASGNINNGELCQFAGVQGDHILIKKVVASEIIIFPEKIIGIATQNINNGDFGYVTWFGKVNGIYTNTPNNNDSVDWQLGDILYFDNVTGQLTKINPEPPHRRIVVASVIKLQTGNNENGIIIVRPTFGLRLTDLDDVNGTPLTTDGQILTYDLTNNWLDFNKNINDYLEKNVAITGATKTKITYDAKGLVTSGADATTNDISDTINKRYVSDTDLINLSNLSGTNTGDQDLSGKQDLLVSGTNIKTVNNETLLGSGNITTGNLSGTIATNQIAFGSGINTISGASDFTYSANRLNVQEINITNALFSDGSRFLSENRTLFSTAIGYQSLINNTTGMSNTALGYQSLLSNTTGSYNNAIGHRSLSSNTTGGNNIAIGYQTLHLNKTGDNNTAIGYQSAANTTGSNNTAIGHRSLSSNTTGMSNTAIGYQSLRFNTTGSNNTVIGEYSGRGITSGVNNVAIGFNANSVGNLSNTITIGVNVNPIAADTVRIGGETHTNTYLYGTLNQLSTGATRPVAIFTTAVSQSANIFEIRDSANTLLTNFSSNGAFQPVSLTDATAPNSSLYYSSTQSRFVYKDSTGNYNNLIQTGNITTQITAINDVIEYNGNSNINLTADPQIVVGTNGRRIIIINSSTNTVTINNGNGVRLNNGLSFTFNQGDTMQLVYSTSLSAWLEVARSENS